MPAQTTTEKYIFPDGVALEVSTDDGSTYHSLGTMAAGTQFTYNYDKLEVESGNNGKPISRAKNETVTLAPSEIWTMDPEVMEKFSGTAFNYSAIAGTLVAAASQLVASGAWGYNDFIAIANQNYDGGVITVNSVTAGTNGLLVSGTDYFIGTNDKGVHGIFVIDSLTVTTEAQTITIVYDYTPATGKKITAGTSSVNLTRFVARLRHYTDVALTTWDVQCIVYGCDMDSGFAINFKGANEDGLVGYTVAFTGNIDTSLTDGAQLFELTINDAALTNA